MRIIHKTAIIDPSVELPANIEIGSYSIINEGVRFNENTVIGSHCVIGKAPRKGRNQLPLNPTTNTVHIGENTIIGDFVSIYNEVIISHDCYIADRATIREQVVIDADVVIGLAVVVSYRARIGRGTKIMTNSNIGGEFIIGDDCFIGLHVCMFNDRRPMEAKVDRSELPKSIIGDRVMIGSNSSIYPGIEIASDIVVGVGSLVNKCLDTHGGTYIGAPAKIVATQNNS